MTLDSVDLNTLKTSITAAEREVDIAERHLKNKQLALQFLQNQLRDLIIADVNGSYLSQVRTNSQLQNKIFLSNTSNYQYLVKKNNF